MPRIMATPWPRDDPQYRKLVETDAWLRAAAPHQITQHRQLYQVDRIDLGNADDPEELLRQHSDVAEVEGSIERAWEFLVYTAGCPPFVPAHLWDDPTWVRPMPASLIVGMAERGKDMEHVTAAKIWFHGELLLEALAADKIGDVLMHAVRWAKYTEWARFGSTWGVEIVAHRNIKGPPSCDHFEVRQVTAALRDRVTGRISKNGWHELQERFGVTRRQLYRILAEK